MTSKKVAVFLDDMTIRHELFTRDRAVEFEIYHTYTFADFFNVYNRLSNYMVIDFVSLDHDLGDRLVEGTGMMAAEFLALLPRDRRPLRLEIHSWNFHASKDMYDFLLANNFSPELRPFGGGEDGWDKFKGCRELTQLTEEFGGYEKELK